MNISFKFRFSVKSSKDTKYTRPTVLYARITVNGKAATDFSTGITVLPADWDQLRQCVKPSSLHATTLNGKLARIRYKVDKIWGEFDLRDEVITAQDLRRMYLGGHTKPVSLTELLDLYRIDLKSRVAAIPRGKQIVQETYNVYDRYTNNLHAWLNESKLAGLTASLLDDDRMRQAEDYLHIHYAPSYAAKQMEFLKAVMSFGVRKRLLRFSPVATYTVAQDDSTPELVFLMPDELSRLRETDFAALPAYRTIAGRLDRTRDAFLAMLALGTHYGEYRAFVTDPDQYLAETKGIRFFRKQRQKTGVWALAPITPELDRLFAKYGGPDKLPLISNTKFNDYLKTVAAAAGINKVLTTKAARKTFADTHLNEVHTDSDTTARMMGLTSTTYLKHYGQTDERRIITKLNLMPVTPVNIVHED